jgi:hypothetical protein
LLTFVLLHGGTVSEGYAPHYSKNLMAQVARNRDIVPSACMVSRPRGPIGGWVWVYGVRTGALLHCKIVDVSAPVDLARHERTGRIAEISYEVAAELCGSTRERVIDCPVMVVAL